MLDTANLLQLMKNLVRATPSTAYTVNGVSLDYNAMNEVLRNEFNALVGNEELWQTNKYKVFSLIEQTIDDILPTRLQDAYGSFAEVTTFAQGDRPVFKRKTGKTRAKQFITRVGLAGVYETFKLGEESFEVQTSAMGGAARIGFEEFLDGRVNFAELTQIIMDGMDELLQKEIAQALQSAISQLPVANKVTVAGYDEASLDYLIKTARAYGTPTIYCSYDFATKIVPETGWISDNMRDAIWNTGYLASYKGTRIMIMPNTLEDESNSRWTLNPGYVWVIPSGANDKPVKVAFEGATHVRERTDNDDWSRDIQVYRKVGVGVMMTNNIFSYVDTTLLNKMDNVAPVVTPPSP